MKVPPSVRAFEEVDIYGGSAGYASMSDAQVLVAPLPAKQSWLANHSSSEAKKRSSACSSLTKSSVSFSLIT